MPQKNCVEDPQLQEIMDVLQHLGFEHVVEASFCRITTPYSYLC